MAHRRRLPHVAALDGLRGVAVAGVLAFHAGHLRGGYLGVDLFFVLSGYLITSLLVAEWRDEGSISLRAFWSRRARRLLPALLLLVAGLAVWVAVDADARAAVAFRGDALATLGYVANWHALAAGRGYWDLFASPSLLEHAWSLAIEEQFYVVWPLVAVALLRGRHGLRRLLAATVALASASALAMVLLHHAGGGTDRVYFGTDTRAAAILAGAALALLTALAGPARGTAGRVLLEAAAVAGAAGLAWAWAAVPGTSDRLYEGGFALAAVAAALVVAAAAHPVPGPLARGLSWRPLQWLGRVSYGLYLWHWPVFVILTPERTGLRGPALLALELTVTFALTIASYLLLELPIRRGALGSRAVRLAAPGAFAAACVAVVAAAQVPAPAPVAATVGRGGLLEVASRPGAAPPAPPIVAVTAASPGAEPLVDALVAAGHRFGADVRRGGRGAVAALVLGPDLAAAPPCPRARGVLTAMVERLAADASKVVVVTAAPDPRGPLAARRAVECVNAAARGVAFEQRALVAHLAAWVCDEAGPCRDTTVSDQAGWALPAVLDLGGVAPAASVRPLLVGDSTALKFGEAVAGERVGQVAAPRTLAGLGCGLVPGKPVTQGRVLPADGCSTWAETWRLLVGEVHPDVVVVMNGAWDVLDRRIGTRTVRFGTAAYDALLRDALGAAIDAGSADGARVAFLTAPCFRPDPDAAVPMPERGELQRIERYNAILRSVVAARAERASVVDFGGFVCPGGRDLPERDGVTMRYDGVHLTPQGAEVAWRWLAPRLEALVSRPGGR